VYALLWSLVSAALVLAAVRFGLGLRADLRQQLGTVEFWLPLAFAVVLLFAAARSAFLLALPGRDATRARTLPVVLVWLLLVALLIETGTGLGGSLVDGLALGGLACSAVVTVLSIVPTALAILMLRRLAPMNARAAAWAAGLAGSAAGLLGISLFCHVTLSMHVCVYHVLPVPILAGLAATGLARLLRW
jgi:hypothetical protein